MLSKKPLTIALLAAVVLGCIIVGIAYLISTRVTEPTAFTQDPTRFDGVQLPIDPRSLVSKDLKPGDAGDLYRSAIKDYQDNLSQYERLATRFNLEQAQAMAGVAGFVEAAQYAHASLFDKDVALAVDYGTPRGVAALNQLGVLCGRIAMQQATAKQYDDARKYLQAQFMAGLHMFEQRLGRQEMVAGVGLMSYSALLQAKIAKTEGNEAAAAKFDAFVKAYRTYWTDKVEPMERVLTSIDPKVQSQHIGDVMVIAARSSERAWRVEATLKLGMYKFFHNTPGDRRAAEKMISQFKSDADPAVALAAEKASELTLEQFRTLGSK